MSDKARIEVGGGLGALGILGIIFVVMKVSGYGLVATWSWWLVLLPFYIGIPIALLIVIGAVIFACIAAALD